MASRGSPIKTQEGADGQLPPSESHTSPTSGQNVQIPADYLASLSERSDLPLAPVLLSDVRDLSLATSAPVNGCGVGGLEAEKQVEEPHGDDRELQDPERPSHEACAQSMQSPREVLNPSDRYFFPRPSLSLDDQHPPAPSVLSETLAGSNQAGRAPTRSPFGIVTPPSSSAEPSLCLEALPASKPCDMLKRERTAGRIMALGRWVRVLASISKSLEQRHLASQRPSVTRSPNSLRRPFTRTASRRLRAPRSPVHPRSLQNNVTFPRSLPSPKTACGASTLTRRDARKPRASRAQTEVASLQNSFTEICEDLSLTSLTELDAFESQLQDAFVKIFNWSMGGVVGRFKESKKVGCDEGPVIVRKIKTPPARATFWLPNGLESRDAAHSATRSTDVIIPTAHVSAAAASCSSFMPRMPQLIAIPSNSAPARPSEPTSPVANLSNATPRKSSLPTTLLYGLQTPSSLPQTSLANRSTANPEHSLDTALNSLRQQCERIIRKEFHSQVPFIPQRKMSIEMDHGKTGSLIGRPPLETRDQRHNRFQFPREGPIHERHDEIARVEMTSGLPDRESHHVLTRVTAGPEMEGSERAVPKAATKLPSPLGSGSHTGCSNTPSPVSRPCRRSTSLPMVRQAAVCPPKVPATKRSNSKPSFVISSFSSSSRLKGSRSNTSLTDSSLSTAKESQPFKRHRFPLFGRAKFG